MTILLADLVAAQQQRNSSDMVDQLVLNEMAERKIPGASVAVIKNGEIIKKATYGLASIEFGVPVTNGTLFHLASTRDLFACSGFTRFSVDALAPGIAGEPYR